MMFEQCPTFAIRRRSLNQHLSSYSFCAFDEFKGLSVVVCDKGVSQNEDFACYNPPSVTLVSFGCCVLLAVSLTSWCRWLVGGAFTCVSVC